ncbi:FAD-dependent oxidoreductase [Deferrisoma sp.]
MIVGGGISGIQGALDLATAGFKVYLVDKAPAIGGHMAQLDKTFPTNDCSMCIESPKFVECHRHPNIEIITYAEVAEVEGEAGDFTVTLVKKPRYVREDRCTGCGVCTEYCPVEYPDEFNQGISQAKAVHIYFGQAIPLVPYIDDSCLYLKERKCRICVDVCKARAIDFNQKPQKVEIKVGAIILAPGFTPYDPRIKPEYHYGEYPNVVTSLDFERIMCATGPNEGEILRPSDGRHPHKIAWLHCVGSRQVTEGARSYCSAVCCTYTQKQVILTKDHDAEAECVVFHNDIRAYGKDFERFYQRAAALPGVRFVRSYASIVREDPETHNVVVRYTTPEGVKEEEFDMVVLSVGLTPPKDADRLAQTLGIELNSHGFHRVDPANPMRTRRPGVFVSGAFQGPLDIPEAVVSASGAGSQCGELLAKRRGRLVKERVYPLERDVSGEEPRIGVYVCHCGANIGRVVDIPSAVEYAKTLPNVVHAEESIFICSTDAAQRLAQSIQEHNLNRVVVAACTPRTHEPLFRDTLREAGINQYYFEFANIREHCSWVHSREKEEATRKAFDLIRMSVARAARLEPLEEFELPVNKTALVIGGGIAGMTAALSIANQGFPVHLVEKEPELGGMARRLTTTLEGLDVQAYLRDLVAKVLRHPGIRVYTGAQVEESSGYVGNFVTRIRTADGRVEEVLHGVAVVAIGAEEYKPSEYLYDESDRVVTNLELEERLASGDERFTAAEIFVMIQCVGCRTPERNYCARVCCSQSVKNALRIKEQNPEADVYILFRDMRTYGFREDRYREASMKGVKFIRYEPENPPRVEKVSQDGSERIRVVVPDPILETELVIDADVLALAAGVVPASDRGHIAKQFKANLSPDKFFQEAHVKLRPVDFGAEGVYLCGMAHYPKHIPEVVNQAYGAAGRVAVLLANDTVVASGSVCDVDEKSCIGCGQCAEVCAYGAIDLRTTRQGRKAVVNPVLCKGDGLCNAVCPTGAISLKHYRDEALVAQIDALTEEEKEEKEETLPKVA